MMGNITSRRLRVFQMSIHEVDWLVELYGGIFDPNHKSQIAVRLDQIQKRFATLVEQLKTSWIKHLDIAEAIAPRVNGSPDAWFVNLICLMKRIDSESLDHACRHQGFSYERDEKLDASRRELGAYEHTVEIAMARISADIPDALVDVKSIAAAVHTAETTVRKYSKAWGPKERNGKGQIGHLWKWSVVRPKLIEQTGKMNIPLSPPPPAKRSPRKKTA